MKTTKQKGHLHPLSILIKDIVAIFHKMGFAVAEGPEVETEFYNFDALNIPEWHPSRDMWDTFWLKPTNNQQPTTNKTNSKTESGLNSNCKLSVVSRKLLRTHTSPVQIRYMEKHGAPIRIIVPGKVYRHEATDATHEAQFYQLEGLMVEEDVSLSHFKGVMERFFSEFFGNKVSLRLRPSYFPFVEPGVEADVTCVKCQGQGCSVCKQTGWIELLGAGMVHPKVLEYGGVNPKKFRGFAFGVGIDRLAVLKYGIDDIRILYQGDLRLVNQF